MNSLLPIQPLLADTSCNLWIPVEVIPVASASYLFMESKPSCRINTQDSLLLTNLLRLLFGKNFSSMGTIWVAVHCDKDSPIDLPQFFLGSLTAYKGEWLMVPGSTIRTMGPS